MMILINILDAICWWLIPSVINIYLGVWGVWIIIGWLQAFGVVRLNYQNAVIRFFATITDGFVTLIFKQHRVKFHLGPFDLSPMLLLFGLIALEALVRYGYSYLRAILFGML